MANRQKLDDGEVLTHPDCDVQDLLNSYVYILKQFNWSSGRCIRFEPKDTDSDIACCINRLGLRVVLDIVGSHERTMPTLLQLLDSKTCIVNLAIFEGPDSSGNMDNSIPAVSNGS